MKVLTKLEKKSEEVSLMCPYCKSDDFLSYVEVFQVEPSQIVFRCIKCVPHENDKFFSVRYTKIAQTFRRESFYTFNVSFTDVPLCIKIVSSRCIK